MPPFADFENIENNDPAHSDAPAPGGEESFENEEDWFALAGEEEEGDSHDFEEGSEEANDEQGSDLEEAGPEESEDEDDQNDEPEPENPKVAALEAQVQQLMQQINAKPAADLKEAEEFLAKPFAFSAPENVAESEHFSAKAKAWFASDPEALTAFAEVANLVLMQQREHQEKVSEYEKTVAEAQAEREKFVHDTLVAANVDPKFVEEEAFSKFAKIPEVRQQAAAAAKLYGQSSTEFWFYLHRMYRNHLSANAKGNADKARENAANKSRKHQRTSPGKKPPSRPPAKKRNQNLSDEEFFASMKDYEI